LDELAESKQPYSGNAKPFSYNALMEDRSQLPAWLWPRAAYVHIPFCAHHCGYCDFAVVAGQDHRIDLYLEALAIEFSSLKIPSPVDTIFVGGGTPTYLEPKQLERFLIDLRQWLPLKEGGEFSIESTPESLSDEKVHLLARYGVNRVSIGVQSFSDRSLESLDRRHSSTQVGQSLELVRRHIGDVSLDLIFGVPGQTVTDWEMDLRRALDYGPVHFSTYGLTYEKGTPLWKRRERGEIHSVEEEVELRMYERSIEVLSGAGFEHYEVSNFAKPGHRCRHNETYWANEAYFGFGLGAAKYLNGTRSLNRRSFDDYLRKVFAEEEVDYQHETLSQEERAQETAAINLRRRRGIDRVRFQEQTGFSIDSLLGNRLKGYKDEGLLEDDGAAVSLSRKGLYVADVLISRLVWG
jgi:oxygen-independent coproporphyrinogen-3 oxidase